MTCYLVVFEIKELAQRQQLKELMKTFGAYCPVTRSCWAITSDKKAAEIRDELKPAKGPGDRLFVFRSGTEAAWINAISDKHSQWLKKYL